MNPEFILLIGVWIFAFFLLVVLIVLYLRNKKL